GRAPVHVIRPSTGGSRRIGGESQLSTSPCRSGKSTAVRHADGGVSTRSCDQGPAEAKRNSFVSRHRHPALHADSALSVRSAESRGPPRGNQESASPFQREMIPPWWGKNKKSPGRFLVRGSVVSDAALEAER